MQWQRLDQEEPFVGRCGDVGDELGSQIVATRQVQNIMRLAFLYEKEYAPYNKWFGSAFAKLGYARELQSLFNAIFGADRWQTRQAALGKAYEFMARWHNRLGLTDFVPEELGYFHERPYLVINAGNFTHTLLRTIQDPTIHHLSPKIGNIDQFCDSTDVLSNPTAFHRLKQTFFL
jgi:hypothetical protein